MIQRLLPYLQLMRLNKPIGTLLLLWPTLSALIIATHGHPSTRLLLIFIGGVIIMRSAGCIINDITDRDIDGHVQRTQGRPLATGALSIRQAITCLVILLFIALGLVLLLNRFCLLLSLAGLSLTILYPLMKRCCPTPQIILGLTFNWGVIIAFAATKQTIPAIAWAFYGVTLLWTVAYDTQYAMVDRDDDIKLGLYSTAILFDRYDKSIIACLQFLVIAGLIFIGIEQSFSWVYFFCIGLCALLFLYQQHQISNREPSACFNAFLTNNHVGLLLTIGTLTQYHIHY